MSGDGVAVPNIILLDFYLKNKHLIDNDKIKYILRLNKGKIITKSKKIDFSKFEASN